MIITKNIAISENIRFTNADPALDNGNKYLGIYTFFNNGALPIIAYVQLLVISEFKVKIRFPAKK